MTTFSDLQQLGETAGRLLIERDHKLGVAESSTGGLISAALLAMPGASAFYLGGTVIYTGRARGLLFEPGDLPESTRGATQDYAERLAAGVAAKLGCGWAISETGATGPTGNPYGDPPGHSWVGVARPDGTTVARNVLTGDDDRAANMFRFADACLRQLIEQLRVSESGG